MGRDNPIAFEVRLDWTLKQRENIVLEHDEEADRHCKHDSDNAPEQSPAQLLEMVKEGHFLVRAITLLHRSHLGWSAVTNRKPSYGR
jgi:hypothetical protein